MKTMTCLTSAYLFHDTNFSHFSAFRIPQTQTEFLRINGKIPKLTLATLLEKDCRASFRAFGGRVPMSISGEGGTFQDGCLVTIVQN